MKLRFDVYIIDDDYFKGQIMKKRVLSTISDATIHLLNCNEWIKKKRIDSIQANVLFLISTNSNTHNQWLRIAKKLREINWLCQIIIYGDPLKLDYQRTINLVSPVGVLDFSSGDNEKKTALLIRKARVAMDSFTKNDGIVEIKLKSKVLFYSSTDINYISTVKGERNKTVIHTQKGIDYLPKSIKEIKELSFPDFFYSELRSFIINIQEIQSVSHSESAVIFFNGEVLYAGIKVRKKITDYMKKIS